MLLRRLRSLAVQVVAISVITLALLEGLVVFSLRHPAIAVIPLSILRPMHVLFDRNTIQVMPECAVYDEGLTYTLRPGHCTFANPEFSNALSINTLGVRDDEASLDQPGVVMLGDSITMGWGVNQDEAFPSVFERKTGRRTLNAGVASYGTVRELRMLSRVDRRAATDIVIQYSGNDLAENEDLVAGRFKILSREGYQRTVRAQEDMLWYHPGKHTLNLMVMLRNSIRARNQPAPALSPARTAEVFLRVIEQSPVDLSPFRVTVLSLESPFIDAVRPLAQAASSAVIQRLQFVDASSISATPGAFYVLDDHPTRIGQAAIARLLIDAIEKRP